MNRLVITLLGIVAAVGGSGLVFIGVNKLFDLTENRYPRYSTIAGGLLSGGVFLLLWGNRMIDSPVAVTIIALIIGGASGFALALIEDQTQRIIVGAAAGGALGLLLGWAADETIWPSIGPVGVIVGLAVGVGLGFLVWVLKGRDPNKLTLRLLAGASFGWLLGAWVASPLRGGLPPEELETTVDLVGSRAEAFVAAIVLGLLVGVTWGYRPMPSNVQKAGIALGSRKYIFLAPALLFVGSALVIPLLRTIWLSFLSGNPNDLSPTGFSNYAELLRDPGIINFDRAGDILTSSLFWLAIIVAVGGILAGRFAGRQIGAGFSVNPGNLSLMAGGVVLLLFAVFTNIRGTIPNNLWWILSVITFAVTLGLAVAVLADRSKGENIAKSLIFLPMAISFVGASIIWRLIYIARPPQDPQSGVLNSLWVMVGEWSNSGVTRTIVTIVLLVFISGFLYLAWRGWQAGSTGILAASLALIAGLGWLIYQFQGPGIGGFETSEFQGAMRTIADPILFIQEGPWNNFWMMVVFIWIQTGFAMVIFSAAIKAVPEDLLEAARIDGATESQTFWRVTIPQIYPTIGVVVTTLIVQTLKIFDIPKVMTNGNFDTQVLANEMWERAFTQLDFGMGSAVAVLLFIAVLPVMAINIRRMQRERLG